MLTRMTLGLRNGGFQSITFVNLTLLGWQMPAIQRSDVRGWSVVGTAAGILSGLGCRP